MNEIVCEQHKQEYTMHCVDCNANLCSTCIKNHSLHAKVTTENFHNFSEAYMDYQHIFLTYNKLKDFKTILINSINSLCASVAFFRERALTHLDKIIQNRENVLSLIDTVNQATFKNSKYEAISRTINSVNEAINISIDNIKAKISINEISDVQGTFRNLLISEQKGLDLIKNEAAKWVSGNLEMLYGSMAGPMYEIKENTSTLRLDKPSKFLLRISIQVQREG